MRFGARRLFKNLSLSLSKGSHLAITGPNGSGKSTLLRILCGLTKATSGIIEVKGLGDPNSISKRRLNCGYVAPSANLYEGLTARENLEFIAEIRPEPNLQESLDSVLENIQLDQRSNEFVSTFSSGMTQRLKLGAAILAKPFFLVLDEPYSNLDQQGIDLFDGLVNNQLNYGAVIVATNNPDIAARAEAKIDIRDFPW